jgi:hypothetical protein
VVASLCWDDFAHLGELRDLAERMVADQGAGVPKAANILIYGPQERIRQDAGGPSRSFRAFCRRT